LYCTEVRMCLVRLGKARFVPFYRFAGLKEGKVVKRKWVDLRTPDDRRKLCGSIYKRVKI